MRPGDEVALQGFTLYKTVANRRKRKLKDAELFTKAPAKRSQHINTTYRNIVGPAFANSSQAIKTFHIDGFRGGADGAATPPPPFFKTFLYDPNPSNRPENRFIKCFLILSSETLTSFHFLPRIRPQCCMLHPLKSEVFIQRGGGGVGTRAPLSEVSGSALVSAKQIVTLLHAFGHPVATCCDMLGMENRTSAHALHEPGQTTTTTSNIEKCCMKNLTCFKFEPTTPGMSQHFATRNRVAKRMHMLR